MSSSRPYLIRALYDWIIDEGWTPYLVISASHKAVQVPHDYVSENRIILNISPEACRGLHLENDRIVFSARFDGDTHQIFAPPAAVLAIYAKENGQGMVFNEEEGGEGEGGMTEQEPPPRQTPPRGNKKANLKVIK